MNTLNITRLASAAAAVAATAVLLAGPVSAQQAEEPLSRAAVNQETRAAIAAGALMPAGEGRPQGPEAVAVPTKSREERKAQTMEARRNGEFQPGGMGNYKSNMSQQTATVHSTKTREERKAETLRAAREGKLLHAGEAA